MREREKKEEGQEPQRKSETNRLVGHSERPGTPEVPGLELAGILTLERLPGRSDLRGRGVYQDRETEGTFGADTSEHVPSNFRRV